MWLNIYESYSRTASKQRPRILVNMAPKSASEYGPWTSEFSSGFGLPFVDLDLFVFYLQASFIPCPPSSKNNIRHHFSNSLTIHQV